LEQKDLKVRLTHFSSPPSPISSFSFGFLLNSFLPSQFLSSFFRLPSKGLVTANGPRWEVHRRIANKALLAPQAVAKFSSQINSSALRLTEQFLQLHKESKDGSVSLLPSLTNYTCQVILSVGFGDVGVKHNEAIREFVDSFFSTAKTHFFLPLPYPPSEQLQDFRRRLAELREISLSFLKESREAVEAGQIPTDFATILFSTKDEETGQYLEPHEVLSDTLDIVNGGTDTTAALLCYTLHLLAHHPEIAEEVYQEVHSVKSAQTQSQVRLGT
jgi:cytochrome P450